MPTFIHGKGAYFALSTGTTGTYASASASFVNFSSGIEDVSFPRSVDTAEVTSYGDNDKNFISGLRSGTVSVTGIWASTYEEKIAPLLGATNPSWFKLAPAGLTSGKRLEYAKAYITGYEMGVPSADKVSMKFDLQITGAVVSTNAP